MERLKCKNKLLIRPAEGGLDSSVRRAGSSSRYVKRSLEALEPQYVPLAVSITQKLGALCGMEVCELNHFGLVTIRKGAGLCLERCSRLAQQRDGESVVPIPQMVAARSGRRLLPSFSTE